MNLYLVRHAPAEPAGSHVTDAERRLTPGGRRKMHAAAKGMRQLKLKFKTLATSPLPRAMETAAIIAEELGWLAKPIELDALAPGAPLAETLDALRKILDGHGDVMVVGHEPGLSRMAAQLLTGNPEAVRWRLKKGGLIGLELPSESVPRGRATLRFFLPPRVLRAL